MSGEMWSTMMATKPAGFTCATCGITDVDIAEYKAVAAEHWRLVEENAALRKLLDDVINAWNDGDSYESHSVLRERIAKHTTPLRGEEHE